MTAYALDAKRVKQIARHLTGMELQDMIEAYNRGAAFIPCPRGQKITREGMKQVAQMLGKGALA